MNQPARNVPAVREQRVAVDLSKPLADLDQALRLADALSQSDLVPRALYGKPANVLHVLMTGQQMGLHWAESIRVIYSPGQGQIGLRGQFLLSRVRQAGHRYTITDGDGECTFKLTRGDTGEEFESTFTIEDAIQGGLATRKSDGTIVALSRDGKPLPWQSWTRRMLRWRAVSDCVGFGAPECLLGFEVEGAEAPADAQPEVVLQPQSSAPPAPDAREAAPGDGQAAQAQQLSELDRRMQENLAAVEEAEVVEPEGPADDSPAPATGDGGTAPPPAGEWGPETAPPMDRDLPEPGQSAAAQAQTQVLAERFTTLGWNPKDYRADVLKACSMFAGRRIGGVRDLTGAEVLKLTAALAAVQRKTKDETHYPVALAEQVEVWREKWAETDPAGYAEYEAGQ